MENTDSKHYEDPNAKSKPIETDYAKHENDPGPSPEAVKEKDENGAGPVMKWTIPIIILILLIFWFIFFK